MHARNTKLVLKHLGFLRDDYNFAFSFQTFDEYQGFSGPINTYSFYNQHGCFTLHHIVQLNEWTWFLSASFSTNQYELLTKRIEPNLFISTHCWRYSTVLKRLSAYLRNQINNTGKIFSISIE